MKRKLLAVFLLMLCVCSAGMAEEWCGYPESKDTGFVLCESLTICLSPWDKHSTVERMGYGSTFQIRDERDGWYGVTYRNPEGYYYNGWVRGDYVLKNPAYYTAKKETAVYAIPDTAGKRVGLLEAGDSFPIICEYGEYYVISLRGASGFVLKK